MDRATDRLSRAVPRAVAPLLVLLGLTLVALAQGPSGPPRVVVKDVVYDGLAVVPAARVAGIIRTRPGTEYSRDIVQQDATQLMATKLFGNVRAEVEPVGADMRNAKEVIVHFILLELGGKVQEIVFEGAKHGDKDELRTATGIQKGGAMNPLFNRLACEHIVEWYREKGRPLAHCELLEGNNPSDSRVVFSITEGPVVRVSSIEIDGSEFVSSPVLKTHVDASRAFLGLLGGKYKPEIVNHDVTKLEEYYRSFGFHDVRVSRELVYSDDLQYVKIIYHVHEGQRYRVTGAQVQVFDNSGDHRDPAGVMSQLQTVAHWDTGYYDDASSKVRQEDMKNLVGYKGYNANVQQEIVWDNQHPGECSLIYNVHENGPARVKEIKIIGNDVTRENVIRRQLLVYPGQVLTYPDLKVSEQRLARLGIFKMEPENGIKPTVSVVEDPNDPFNPYKDVLVQVTEDRTGSLMFGVGVNSDQGLTGSIVLNERNFDILRPPTSLDDFLAMRAFRGAGQEFRLEAMPGTLTQRYSASWREPFLFDTPNSLKLDGYYYEQSFDEYLESRLGGRVTVGRKVADNWTVSVSTRLENVGIHDVVNFAPQDFQSVVGDNFLAGVRAGVQFDTRDSYLHPTKGTVLEFSYEQVMGDFTFPKIGVEANQYFTMYQRADGSGRHVLQLHSQVDWAGSNAPVFERFYAGGFQSLRGFAYRGVGPELDGFRLGGDFMFLNSIEYQIPVMANDRLFLVGFIDSGTVESNVSIKDYRVSAGVGLRVVVPMLGPVPIALDLGFPIVKGPNDHEQVFSFWLGFFH